MSNPGPHIPLPTDSLPAHPLPVPPGERSPAPLVFPPEHELSKLWTIWSALKAEDHPLKLCLTPAAEQSLFTCEELTHENPRLWDCLTQAARRRFREIAAVPPGEPVNLDEKAFVFFSENEMGAWLFLLPPIGEGCQLTPSQIHQFLVKHGVSHGIDWQLLWKFSSVEQRYFHMFPVAQGELPTPGEDGKLLDHFPRQLQEDVQVEGLGQQDYISLKLVQEIQEGDVICEIVPPIPGTDGVTVTGKPLPPPPVNEASVPQGRNTHVTDDGKYLVAEKSGHLAFSGVDFQVKPVLHLRERDLLESDTIKFLGDIHIHCDIDHFVSICATGTVQVDGAVECCTIEAGENIILSSGVQGQDHGVLHAQRSLYAKYLEHCTVFARDNVYADCMINCNIHCNGSVQVRTGRGVIVGGIVRSASEVRAITVGSKAERPTLILLGGQPCEEAECAQVQQEIDQLGKAIQELAHKPEDAAAQQELSKLRLRQCVAKMKLDKFKKELESHATLFTVGDRRKLFCDVIYPGSTVTINHSSYHVNLTQRDCIIGVVGGRVSCL